MDPSTPPVPLPPANGFGTGASTGAPQREPRTVDASNGVSWWGEGWRLFTKAAGMWILITVVFVIIMICLSLIPLVGSVATTILSPVFAAGVMLGCREIDRGGSLTFNHLFAGFTDRLAPLGVVGLLYLLGSCVVMVIVIAILAVSIGLSGVAALFSGGMTDATFAALSSFGLGAVIATLIGLALVLLLVSAVWFAPALVVLRNEEPLASMRLSFNASFANFMPMLVYGLLGIVFCIGASLPLMLGWFVLAPVTVGSIYASYKDIFEG